MNRAGETIAVTTDICLCITDDDIQVISKLSTLAELRFRADFATDKALDYLADNPRLKIVQVMGENHGFTAEGLQHFHQRRPDVTVSIL
jgi:hypothetical protein